MNPAPHFCTYFTYRQSPPSLHGRRVVVLTIVINCGLCEAFIGTCIESVRMQRHTDWQAFVTVDRRGDRTYERALEARGGDSRVVVTRNRRRLFPMEHVLR